MSRFGDSHGFVTRSVNRGVNRGYRQNGSFAGCIWNIRRKRIPAGTLASEMAGWCIIRAKFLPLRRVSVYLRLAHDWRWLSDGQHEHVSRMVAEIGRLLGAWLKRPTG